MKYIKTILLVLAVPALAAAIFIGGIDPYSADSMLAIVGFFTVCYGVSFLYRVTRAAGPIAENTGKMISAIRQSRRGTPVRISYESMIKAWGLTPQSAGTAIKVWSACIAVIAIIGASGFVLSGFSVYSILIAVVCGIGAACLGWRVHCLARRQYTPLKKWLTFRGFAPLLVLALVLAVSGPDMAFAASAADIDLPSQMEVQKKDDLSANIFNHLFGSAWQGSAGAGTGSLINSEQLGAYSELILTILGALNAAAMIFVAMSVIYMTGVFAVVTAHEGKSLGGSMFNSLWVPIRFTLGMSLTAPVLNGLSLLQVGLLMCLGASINMANNVWDTAGAHIVKHAHTKIIEGTPTYLEQEAKTLIAPMLKSTVIQETLIEQSGAWPIKLQGWQINSLGLTPLTNYDNKYIYQQPPLGGNHRILYTPPNQYQVDEIGGFTFTYPAGKDPKQSKDAYIAKKNIADARAKALVEMSEQMRNYAVNYIIRTAGSTKEEHDRKLREDKEYRLIHGPSCRHSKFVGMTPRETKTVDEIIADYAASIREVTASNAASIVADTGVDSLISKAIDHNGSTSRFGWVSAGMFSFSMSALQKKYDDVLSGSDVSFTFASDSAFQNTSGWFDRGFDRFDLDPRLAETIENVDKYSEGIFGGSFYIKKSDYTDDGSLSTAFKKVVASFTEYLTGKFADVATGGSVISSGNTGGANGILAITLYQFKKHDPLVVIAWIGDNLLDAGLWLLALDMGASIFVDIAILSVAGLALCLVGIIFAYVGPIMPLIFWLTALFGWIFLVVETMVAAPLWAASHCLPEGNGLAGQHARKGYIMALDILLRPTLLVIGAVSAIAVMQAAGWFFGTLFDSFFVNIGSFLSFGPIAELIFTIIFVAVMFNLSIKIYTKGMTDMPQRIISWIGGVGASLGEDSASKSTNVVGAVVNQQGGAAASTMKKAAGGAGGILKKGLGKMSGIINKKPA